MRPATSGGPHPPSASRRGRNGRRRNGRRRARGDARGASDVDLGVLLGPADAPTLDAPTLAWGAGLERLLGREVDIVALDDAPPDLVHRVLRDGVLILERDRGARIRFETQARNEYFDVLPFLDRYRRAPRPR